MKWLMQEDFTLFIDSSKKENKDSFPYDSFPQAANFHEVLVLQEPGLNLELIRFARDLAFIRLVSFELRPVLFRIANLMAGLTSFNAENLIHGVLSQ